MGYTQEKQDEIKLKIVSLIENSQLSITHDLEIFDTILEKYNFKTIPNTAKSKGISKQSLYKKVGRDDFPYKMIDTIPFCISSLFL